MTEPVPLLLLSGMAADERLLEPQQMAFPHLRVIPWMAPLPSESLRAYAARLARHVNLGRPCIVGGASFGGVVALELAAHLDARACILIGSIREPSGLPWSWRLLHPVAVLGPDALGTLAGFTARWCRWFLDRGFARRMQRLARPEAAFVRWAMCALIDWRPSPATRGIRVAHIHGSADRVLPVDRVRPDVIVPGGVHALSLFNPGAVNDFIAKVIQSVSPGHEPESQGASA